MTRTADRCFATGVVGESERFSPRRPASRNARVTVLFLVGPLLWVIALAVVGRVVRQLNVIEIGLLAAALSCAISIVLLIPMRVRRAREERASGEHAPLH
jgi:hypothetical protein